MLDLKLSFGSREADLALAMADLEADDSLKTAIIVSLFTDREADFDDELPAGETDRRGWCLDSTLTADGDKIGSKLWLITREKQTEPVRQIAQRYCEEALAWLMDDGYADAVEVQTSWPSRGLLGILVRVDGVDMNFNLAMEA